MSKQPPRPSRSEQPNASSRALEAAVYAMRSQRPDEAERIAAGVLKSDRNNLLAVQILANALLIQNRADEAIPALERAARRSEDPAIETQLAVALAAAGRTDEALDQFETTSARRPPYPQAFLQHGGQLSRMGRFDQAIATLESGIALAPEVLELRMELGFVHLKLNHRARARELFQAVLAVAPERDDALKALAKITALDGGYAAAADIYRRVLARQPLDVVTRNNLGICQLELGDRAAGEASLREAIRGAPQLAGQAITALTSASRGRFFLRAGAMTAFLRNGKA